MIKRYFMALMPTLVLFASLQSMSVASVRTSGYRKSAEEKSQATSIKMSKSDSSAKRPRTNHLGAKLGTDFQFDNLSVHGRYQGAFQGVATVENEKETGELIDYRHEFKDRLNQSVGEL